MQGCNLKCLSCSNRDTWDHNKGTLMSSNEIIKDIKKYDKYVEGCTISGGEPLLANKFVSAIFKECHKIGINTCLDTAGQSLEKNWHEILPETDLVLMCLKHIDPDKYLKFTGMLQKHALKFMDCLNDYQKPFYLRYLYIPTFSDDRDDLNRFLDFAKKQKYLKGIEFLPYHTLGVNKWETMNLMYPLYGVPVPSKEESEEVKNYIRSCGFYVI
jgi:pyruvate formate lyase activating enzyme